MCVGDLGRWRWVGFYCFHGADWAPAEPTFILQLLRSKPADACQILLWHHHHGTNPRRCRAETLQTPWMFVGALVSSPPSVRLVLGSLCCFPARSLVFAGLQNISAVNLLLQSQGSELLHAGVRDEWREANRVDKMLSEAWEGRDYSTLTWWELTEELWYSTTCEGSSFNFVKLKTQTSRCL